MNKKTYTNLLDKIQNTSFTEKDIVLNFFMPIYKLSGNSTIQKTFKANDNKLIIHNDYGTIEIRNRILTEFHLKIFDAVLICGTASLMKNDNDRVGIFFDESEVLAYLNMKTNTTKFRETIKQIADAKYYITVEDYSYSIGIIEKHYRKDETANKKNLIILDPAYVKNQKLNFGINYKKMHNKILQIPYHTIPSMIRYIMLKSRTSSDIRRYHLLDVLNNIGFPISSKYALYDLKANLKKYAKEMYINFGIKYNEQNTTLDYINIEKIEYTNLESKEELKKFINKVFVYKNRYYKIIKIEGESGNWTIDTNIDKLHLTLFFDDLVNYVSKNLLSSHDDPTFFID